jgi:hypothetical protein
VAAAVRAEPEVPVDWVGLVALPVQVRSARAVSGAMEEREETAEMVVAAGEVHRSPSWTLPASRRRSRTTRGLTGQPE